MNALRSGLLLLCSLVAVQAQAAFTDNGDGTVSDSETGLMWDRCSWGLTGADCSGGVVDASFWGDALTKAPAANGVAHKGYTDWRMPNAKELETLVKLDATSAPTIDTTAFPATSGLYASSTVAAGLPDSHAFGVNFSTGQVQRFDGAFKTRLVRGGDDFDALATDFPITVTVSPPEGGTASCTPNPVSPSGSSTCTYLGNQGYSFSSWSGDCTGASCELSNVTSEMSVTANFTADVVDLPITVTVSPPEGGTASCTPNPVSPSGSSTCTYLANQGYTFSSWSGDCTGASCELSNVTSELSVTATFTLDSGDFPITVTVSPPAGGTASCTPNPVSPAGSSTCTYLANEGYTFASWSGDCTGASCELTDVASAKNVTANFTLDSGDLPITVVVSPLEGGTASCSPNPVSPSGSSTCTYTTNEGWLFTGWSGDCTGASCELIEVTGLVSVSANFTLDEPPPEVDEPPQPIPTLATWALVLLSGSLALGGWVFRRR